MVLVVQKVGWGTRTGLDGCRKSRHPLGVDPRTVHPVASRNTDWAIAAPLPDNKTYWNDTNNSKSSHAPAAVGDLNGSQGNAEPTVGPDRTVRRLAQRTVSNYLSAKCREMTRALNDFSQNMGQPDFRQVKGRSCLHTTGHLPPPHRNLMQNHF